MQYLPYFSEDRLFPNLRRNIRGDRIPHNIHDVSLLGKNVYKLVTEQHYEEHCWAPKTTTISVLLLDLIDKPVFYLGQSNCTALFVASHSKSDVIGGLLFCMKYNTDVKQTHNVI